MSESKECFLDQVEELLFYETMFEKLSKECRYPMIAVLESLPVSDKEKQILISAMEKACIEGLKRLPNQTLIKRVWPTIQPRRVYHVIVEDGSYSDYFYRHLGTFDHLDKALFFMLQRLVVRPRETYNQYDEKKKVWTLGLPCSSDTCPSFDGNEDIQWKNAHIQQGRINELQTRNEPVFQLVWDQDTLKFMAKPNRTKLYQEDEAKEYKWGPVPRPIFYTAFLQQWTPYYKHYQEQKYHKLWET